MRRLATDSLSAEGARILLSGIGDKKAAAVIVREIAAATGEKVTERTIARRAAQWWAQRRADDNSYREALALVKAIKEAGLEASEIVTAQLTNALARNPATFAGADPVKAQALNLEAEKLRLKRDELEIKSKQHQLDREKFEAMSKKLDAVKEKAGQLLAAGELSVEAEKRIRDIYALGNDKAA